MEWLDGYFAFVSFADLLRIGIFLAISSLGYLIINLTVIKKLDASKKKVPTKKREQHSG